MPKPFEEWTVLPHGKLSRIDDNLLTVVGSLHMHVGDFPRRMSVVRLQGGKLVIFSAIALHEDEMKQLEAFGEPGFLIVPNEAHRMDAKIWKDRYPSMEVIAPGGVREKVEEIVHVDTMAIDFGDPKVRFVVVPGTENHEAALEVRTSRGMTLIVNDLIWNVAPRPGFGGWVMKALGFTGDEPKIPTVVKMREIKDSAALRSQLEEWASMSQLERIIVSHGDIVERDPSAELHRLAESLAA